MITKIQKRIIIKALKIRAANGENPTDILENYRNLSESEVQEILAALAEK